MLLVVRCVVRCYIKNAYSQLNAFISIIIQKRGQQSFPISRGVFQGDTMSPIIFLLSFNPIIQLANNLQCPGFFFKIPIEHLLSPGTSTGWYKCTVSSYNSHGIATFIPQ